VSVVGKLSEGGILVLCFFLQPAMMSYTDTMALKLTVLRYYLALLTDSQFTSWMG